MLETREEWKAKVDMGWRFCPNCQRDFIRGQKAEPSWVSSPRNPYRGCNNCGMPYNENYKYVIERYIRGKCWCNPADHINDVLGLLISDGGEERIAEFEKLVESVWIKDRRMYEGGKFIIYLAKIAITGECE